jgi:hypothetical protein
MSAVVSYIDGVDRNNPEKARSHVYALTAAGRYWPMCSFGWNRSNGERFSILRGWSSPRGRCKLCDRRVERGLRPVIVARPHKTKWI